ncbi:MAG: carbohydrate ABC transporter permease [Kineosporiaceae bacterium]|nr:carbohydrate ABC transporter permease [Kineosporiaceae bacterium]MBK7624334.1 carbohydrate ABC transporter permease [Kineosporiaceae bacterium]MBK8075218.1 carbohydrate ABC transporter permease [Kineosporiaceae bacterium]
MSAHEVTVRHVQGRVRAIDLVARVGFVVVALIFAFPMLWLVMNSFKTNSEIFNNPFSLPSRLDLGQWAEAWRVGRIGRYVVNSAIVTTVSVVAILTCATAAGYAFSRFRFRGRSVLMGALGLGLLLPLQSYFIAQSTLFTRLQLTDTRWALIIPYTAMGIPLATYLITVYLDAIPEEIFEAARIDGAGDLRTFVMLAVPLVRPGLATVTVFSALSAWNEFLLALLYIQDDALKTIPTGLLAFSSRYVTDYGLLFAALSIVTIPMIVVYVVFNRQIVSGLTAGSLK